MRYAIDKPKEDALEFMRRQMQLGGDVIPRGAFAPQRAQYLRPDH